jgi:hypothetical protein
MAIDRIVGLLGLFVLAGISGALAWNGAGADVRRLICVVWAAVAAGLGSLAILFAPALYRPLERLFAGHGRIATLFEELVLMASSYRRRFGVVAGALVMSIIGHGLFTLAFYTLSCTLFPTRLPSLGEHYVMVPLILFTTAVPLPFGALGLSEKMSDLLFGLVRHPGGAVAMMGYRVLMYAAGLVSLIIYLANAQQVRELTKAPATRPSGSAGSPTTQPASDTLSTPRA